MKPKIILTVLFILWNCLSYSQHKIRAKVKFNENDNTFVVLQEIEYKNISPDTLQHIVLNDWNNAFSSKNSALAKRFSDEFNRSFHLAKDKDRGKTSLKNVSNIHFETLTWKRFEKYVDLIKIDLQHPLPPKESMTIHLSYILQIPDQRFTKYGRHDNGKIYLKDWLLTPCVYLNKSFIKYSNENIDDITNALMNVSITFENVSAFNIASNLNISKDNKNYTLTGNNLNNITVVLNPEKEFTSYKNDIIEVSSSIRTKRLNEFQEALVIDKITRFVSKKLGSSYVNKILVANEDYERQPFYGLNQLPAFMSPYPDELMYELKFLKTYLNAFLKANLQINNRRDYWIADGIQVYTMMAFIDEFYPDLKMTGNLASFKLLKSYNFINIDFNQQYNYLYMLMARKNLDQPLAAPKNDLIKFNEQISNKYKSGLSFNYLDNYLENQIVSSSIAEFIQLNNDFFTTRYDLEMILKCKTNKNIDWFFEELVNSRNIIDYKFGKVKKLKEKDSIIVTIRNTTSTNVPISFYELKNDSVVYKQWIENVTSDTTVVVPRNGSDKLTLNYFNEIPEYNLRNNWRSLKGFFFNNRPLKLNFYKDLEEPYYNQLFYVPEFEYNLYDGLALGVRLNNKSMLNKPFTFSVAPFYSPNTQKIVGKASFIYDHNVREEGKLYRIRYVMSGSQFHYAPDAKYTNLSPTVQFFFRDKKFRSNKNEFIQLKQLYIDREKSPYISDKNTENYTVFNAKYGNFQSEGTKHFSLLNDLQVANSFGKISSEIHYRKLFENNRQITLRFYGGAFLYRSTNSEYFSFGLDRPTDYMFEQGLLGRSETTGLYSQQYIYAEGGFKSKLDNRYANQWITTINGAINVWNWIQVYGDVGFIKSKYSSADFVYDSGIHLNLVPDYFELFLPVYSSNGLELNDASYSQKIRFVITLSPKTLISLFTRKWL